MTGQTPRRSSPAETRLDESLIAPLAPFDSLDRAEIRRILDLATTMRVEKDRPIFEEGAAAKSFFLLLDGTVRVVHLTPAGEQVTVLHIPAGELLGFAAATGRDTYPGTAVAATESIVLSWPMHLWSDFAARHPGFSTATARMIGHRLGELNERVVELGTLHVEQRVARALLRLIEQSGRKTGAGIEIDFPITRQDISDMTGTTLYTVSRLISRWTRDGIIDGARQHKRITVTNAHKLVEIGEAPITG